MFIVHKVYWQVGVQSQLVLAEQHCTRQPIYQVKMESVSRFRVFLSILFVVLDGQHCQVREVNILEYDFLIIYQRQISLRLASVR